MIKIETKNISFAWGASKILNDISINADKGRFIGIIGPNGSGKSTLLKCIYRVLSPDHGCVFIDDTNIKDLSYKESAKKIGVVAQHNAYDFDFSVQDVVMMGRSPHKKIMEKDLPQDYEIIRDALKKVGMLHMIHRSFSSLSGGEQQRVILARTLAQQTEALILDEPTNHLDIKYQFQLLNIVKDEKLTVIFAVHDLNMASLYCDYLYVLKDGNIASHGIPKEILTPKLIKEVYEIDTKIYCDEEGVSHILYKTR